MRTYFLLACLIAAVLALGVFVAVGATTISSASSSAATASSVLDGNYWA